MLLKDLNFMLIRLTPIFLGNPHLILLMLVPISVPTLY